MSVPINKRITIIGSGIAGSFLAFLFAKRGYTVDIYERFSKSDICDTQSQRSYNITLLAYIAEMLKREGLWENLKPYLIPLKGSSTQLSKNSKPIFSPTYDKKTQYYAISRATFLDVLIKKAISHPAVTIHYDSSLLSINRYDKTILIEHTQTKKLETISCNVIFGTDGTNSLVRSFLQQGQHTNHSQEYSNGGYKQFLITKEDVDKLRLQNDTAYTWSAKEKIILAFPNLDGSLASLLIYPKDKTPLAALQSKAAVTKLIQEDFPLLQPTEQNIVEQLVTNPLGTFVTIHTDPWFYKDFMVILGDAAHGFYPFFGQGSSAALGDCMEIIKLHDEYGSNWGKIFPLYQKRRKKHMDALGELSKDALLRYMRNRRADYNAIYDTLEFALHNFLPKIVKPPVFVSVMNDPEHTADFVEYATKQRKIAKRIGASLFVSLVTKAVAVYENLFKGS